MTDKVSGVVLALLLTSCIASDEGASTDEPRQSQPYVGWYMEHEGQGTFQPCGQSRAWRITEYADLQDHAKATGLKSDTPVYIRITGAAKDDEIAVATVEQFGSPVPVRNCALNGT